MSLTSYRAAPPRVNCCVPCPDERPKRSRPTRLNGADRSVRKLPEKATRAEANRVPGVCINADRLWKAPGDVFFEVFVTPKTRVLLAEMHLLPI
jgi:hypothetical protein